MRRMFLATKEIVIHYEVLPLSQFIILCSLLSSIHKYIFIYFSGVARYKYNHEILKSEESYFEGRHVPKSRRISIICRSEPDPEISGNSAI